MGVSGVGSVQETWTDGVEDDGSGDPVGGANVAPRRDDRREASAAGDRNPPAGIGRLQPVGLRELWPQEAKDFTPWLTENLGELSGALGLELEAPEREVSIGPFFLDVLAKTPAGESVVIENQLGPTDHDHLGKLLTYMANIGARKAVWITAEPRPEHVEAVEWFNETTPDDVALYLVQVRAFRIDASRPAPLFFVVAGPVAERKRTERDVRELAERHRLRYEFWQGFLEQARSFTRRFERISPGTENWLAAGAGRSGLSYLVSVRMDGASVSFNVDLGRGKEEETKRVFESLEQRKEEIERAFGEPLEWDRSEDKRAARIAYRVPVEAGLRDRERWPELWEAMGQALARLERAVEPALKRTGR